MNDWYYWSRNQHIHFIRFRNSNDQVATASIKGVAPYPFEWKVNGPC